MKAHDVFYFIKLKNRDQPMQGNLTLYSGFQYYYKWDPEYLTFIPDSKAQDSRSQDPGFRIPLHWATVTPR